MPWPWTSRARLEDKDREIARIEKALAASEAERKRLHDLVYLQNFGQQINDTITVPGATPETQLSPEAQLEKELRQAGDNRRQRIEQVRRTRPSQLPHVIAQEAMSDAARAAHAARGPHPATALFEQARAEVNGKKN